MKPCCRCKVIKPLEEFESNPKKPFGKGYRCKACLVDARHRSREKHWEEEKKRARERYWADPEKSRAAGRKKQNARYPAVREQIIEYSKKYKRQRMKIDPAFRAIYNARNRARKMLKGKIGFSKSLGCSFKQFKAHIESRFQPGMTWDNYGPHGWHIDHIYPLSVAQKEGPEVFAKACRYTNLQPLWAKDNLHKHTTVPQQSLGK